MGAFCALTLGLGVSACSKAPDTLPSVDGLSWAQIEQAARGSPLRFVMWTGDPSINAYIAGEVAPRLRKEFDIRLEVIPGQADIPTLLLNEREAGLTRSSMDLLWINGETFHKLRQLDALHGPFTGRLPNDRYVNWADPTIARDFQQPVEGYEAPWGTTHLLLITDQTRVPEPPTTADALATWILANPGRFTFDASFTGLSFLKSLMYAYATSPQELDGPFDEARYQRLKTQVFNWVRTVRPALWRGGETFPADVTQVHQLFAQGEIDFTISFNDGTVDHQVRTGLFPESSTAYPLDSGMIANTHYLGIVATSPHKAAAMVAINLMQSPELQWRKRESSVWGDGTVLDLARLPAPWPERFAAQQRHHAPSRAELRPYARAEPSPELMIRLDQDFRREILRR